MFLWRVFMLTLVVKKQPSTWLIRLTDTMFLFFPYVKEQPYYIRFAIEGSLVQRRPRFGGSVNVNASFEEQPRKSNQKHRVSVQVCADICSNLWSHIVTVSNCKFNWVDVWTLTGSWQNLDSFCFCFCFQLFCVLRPHILLHLQHLNWFEVWTLTLEKFGIQKAWVGMTTLPYESILFSLTVLSGTLIFSMLTEAGSV